jgi:YegS/Rv2252/BmrU family lipid kinase
MSWGIAHGVNSLSNQVYRAVAVTKDKTLHYVGPRAAGSVKQGFIVLNPVAGEGDPQETMATVRGILGANAFDVYKTTGEESIPKIVKTAVREKSYEWVAAIGGDGTVSQVANGLVGSKIPLGIIPGGTANVLARELGLPQEVGAACELLAGAGSRRWIDALQVGERYFFQQVSVGLQAETMQETPSTEKNRWGMLAYLWHAGNEALGWKPDRFRLTVDGRRIELNASEVVIANTSHMGISDLKWREAISPDDGQVDIAAVSTQSPGSYVSAFWAMLRGSQETNDQFRFFRAKRSVQLEGRRSLPVQGDGEVLEKQLPLTVVVVPAAVQVIVPKHE